MFIVMQAPSRQNLLAEVSNELIIESEKYERVLGLVAEVKMNADPRRPEKVQRFAPKTNGNGQEELGPDYINTLGQYQPTGNISEASESSGHTEQNLQGTSVLEETQQSVDDLVVTTNSTNVVATSPQYGVAIIPNAITGVDLPSDTVTVPTETLTDSTAKPTDEKELHSTPSRNDRFKVVKIASLEPFKRGRWKCMDYVDEAPPAGAARVPQSTGSIQITAGQFMQTQSLPQQQIQQMLLQSGFTNGTQFFTNVPPQMVPQGQYFYPQVANVQSQTMPQIPNSIPAQFISNQPYFTASVVPNAAGFTIPQGFQNVQYVPANLIPNQNSAFVPTSQSVQVSQNFQQGQSYSTQGNVSQSNTAQPMVNGHNYNPQNEQVGGSLPTQSVKSVILNSSNPQPIASQTQVTHQNIQNHMPGADYLKNNASVPVIQSQQYQQNVFPQNVQPQPQNTNQAASNVVLVQGQSVNQSTQALPGQSQNSEQSFANNVYTNPQFAMSVNSLTVLDNSENHAEVNESNIGVDAVNESSDDPAKTNPVVNAIDNKIEQAMDLVKSHLMYTVREEVEVLKEKIAELMEKIQQLETENNFLRSQIPKTQNIPPPSTSNLSQSNTVNPSANFAVSSNTNPAVTSQTSTPVTNPSHNLVSNTQGHTLPPVEGSNLQQRALDYQRILRWYILWLASNSKCHITLTSTIEYSASVIDDILKNIPPTKSTGDELLNINVKDSTFLTPTNNEEVRTVIKSLKNCPSTDPYDISAQTIKLIQEQTTNTPDKQMLGEGAIPIAPQAW
ncbi:hypothetical protein JTB14_023140 [Gonioctena quinquepunctata]|nr:hypothetical protein JTB14_023140 [Gonioctena quinquepunctata]